MHARLRLDIGWKDLGAGLLACGFARGRERRLRRVAELFASDALTVLSVRSGLELYLQALALPPGSEVLVSALTIPHMVEILEEHGLYVVPFALDPRTLAPAAEELERRATPRTRAVLFAHLFGQRADLRPLATLARRRGWLLWEDCAQPFAFDGWRGHAGADLVLFSFGLIKTATAAGGGIVRVADPAVRERMRGLQGSWPVQGRTVFARKLLKTMLLKALGQPVLFGQFVRRCARRGLDPDLVLHAATRSFPGPELFPRLRHAPATPLLALLERRLRNPERSLAAARRSAGETLLSELAGALEVFGSAAPVRLHWVFAVGVDEPARLVRELRRVGFDATALSSLVAVRPTGGGEAPAAARRILERVVYVPLVPGLATRARTELLRILRRAGRGVELVPAPSQRERFTPARGPRARLQP